MKKVITLIIIVVVVIIGSIFLFKISPEQYSGNQAVTTGSEFNIKDGPQISQPRLVGDDDHVQGNKDAKNTFVAYEDFQCPACGLSHRLVTSKIVSELKDTKLVYRHFPLIGLHKNAAIAAYASEAANAQGKFWEMHDQLFEKQEEWSELSDPMPKFIEYAKAVGVSNIDQFVSDVNNKKFQDRIQKDITEAVGLGVNATPTYYFNGTKIQTTDLDGVKKQVESLYK